MQLYITRTKCVGIEEGALSLYFPSLLWLSSLMPVSALSSLQSPFPPPLSLSLSLLPLYRSVIKLLV